MKEVQIGKKYKHFKGNVYTVLTIAKNSETLEKMIVYYHDDDVWVRPYDEFISKVDTKKYPNCSQEYRFELIDND